ncbi:3-phosphoshikimate 1-carboxyvinyltransferase [uncultured Peptoniphilus sp.]|uniref:3-phosphoshikimate 1-carboxyvinyltransferase n=1 Tax=uncultured Peptoniphilus sp. TaxID=254354 RepID=UPI0025DBE2C0|nr:3-phosphoshikimate 1-carboxyvinyltransferase [uncultured Peptoniphilus sp.]
MNRLVENKKLKGKISGITSKSYAHRAIFCAGLAKGKSILEIENLSKDIEASLNSIEALGVKVERDRNKFHISPPEEFNKRVIIDVGESGTTLRFILPILGALGMEAEIIRRGSLIGRTNSVYFDLLPKHGVSIREEKEKIFINGKLKDYKFELPGNISSQFVSGLMLASGGAGEDCQIKLTTETESKPYIDMTIDVMKKFGVKVEESGNSYSCNGNFIGQDYIVEKDWSNALFFLASGVEVRGLDKDSIQGDKEALKYFYKLGLENISEDSYKFIKKSDSKKKITIDAKNIPDTIPILSVLCGVYGKEIEFKNIKRLRLKESDRVKSTVELLQRLGIKVSLREDSFSFRGIKEFKSCEIDSFNDHRIAMSAAIAGGFAKGPVKIRDSECVKKSYKDFYKDLESLGGKNHVL